MTISVRTLGVLAVVFLSLWCLAETPARADSYESDLTSHCVSAASCEQANDLLDGWLMDTDGRRCAAGEKEIGGRGQEESSNGCSVCYGWKCYGFVIPQVSPNEPDTDPADPPIIT